MSIDTLKTRLDAARAIIETPELAKLQAEHAAAKKQYDWLAELRKTDTSSRVATDLAGAKNRVAHARAALDKLQSTINQAREDAERLTRLLDSGVTLETARKTWILAADKQVSATRAAQEAQDGMTAINAALEAERIRAQAASELQSAATLHELGFGPKTDTTAAQATKQLDAAKVKIDALVNFAAPEAQKRIDLANAALVQADLQTRAAERAILQAHADCAELAYAVALESFEAVLLRYHATQIASTGQMGVRADFYAVLNDPRFDDAAELVKASAERGE